LQAIDGDEEKNVPRREVEIDHGVHCASFLLCTCTTGMGRISPFKGLGNKRPEAAEALAPASAWK